MLKPLLTGLVSSLILTASWNLQAEEFNLPELGSPSDQYLTPADEVKLGREFMLNVEKQTDVIDDPIQHRFLSERK